MTDDELRDLIPLIALDALDPVERDAAESAIAAHPGEWARFAGGDPKLTGFFVGKVMAATGGRADGRAVTAALRARLG